MIRTIKVCAGIGDNIWLLQKLINSGGRFNFELPDGKPQRGSAVFDLLPQVAVSSSYVKGLNYKTLAAKTERGKFSDITADSFHLSCNEHLEHGRPLTAFLPDLKISYKLPWGMPSPDRNELLQGYLLDKINKAGGKFIGIYGSAYSTQRAWKQYGAWGVAEWLQLIRMIHAKDPSYTFVIIGAEWDNDFATELIKQLGDIRYINTVGEPLTTFMQWTKLFHYAFYFPSGLPILSETIEGASDCTMFYTTNIAKIMGTWCDPERRAGNKFKECLFCSPAAIFDWCVNNGKI